MRTFPLRIGTPDGLLFDGRGAAALCAAHYRCLQSWQDIATSVPLLEWARPM